MKKIYVIHENDAWVEPLRDAFEERVLPYEEWFTNDGLVRFDRVPPEGVFYNRMSASSHTRGHRYAPELTHVILNWLERSGRRVVNGSRGLYLEISKIAQYAALEVAGIVTPRTIAAAGREGVIRAAREFGPGPYILKPNRGGKGLGVQLFGSIDAIAAFLDGPDVDEPIDGLWLMQEYVQAPEPYIIRCEFVGGKFLYAVRVDASGGFELCPADVCAVDGAFCPVGQTPNTFTITDEMDGHPIVERFERFLSWNDIEIAGIELIVDRSGRVVVYDVNTNTNYNARAEAEGNVPATGMRAIARFLGDELAKLDAPVTASVARRVSARVDRCRRSQSVWRTPQSISIPTGQ